MKSVLTTKTEVHTRFVDLLDNYKKSYEKIDGLSQNISGYVQEIDEQISKGEDFDPAFMKLLLGNLNSEQTQLVNVLKKMNELHAKMGYLV